MWNEQRIIIIADAFFQTLGFEFNQQFTTEDTACMIISDNVFALMMDEERLCDDKIDVVVSEE